MGFFFFLDFIYLQRGEGGQKGRETPLSPVGKTGVTNILFLTQSWLPNIHGFNFILDFLGQRQFQPRILMFL